MRPILIAIFALVTLSCSAFAQDDGDGDGQDAGGTPPGGTNTSDPFAGASTNDSDDPALLEPYTAACSADPDSSECRSSALALCQQNPTNLEACARSTPFIGR